MADFRNEPEPHVDRFKDNTAGGKGAHDFVELEGFEPTTLQTEKESGGWLRTTAPEGVPLRQLPDLYTSGSRGAEGRLTEETLGRTRTKRVMDSTEGGDWDSGDGGDDGAGDASGD